MYSEADGSMILTREEGGSEVKWVEFLKAAIACMQKGNQAG